MGTGVRLIEATAEEDEVREDDWKDRADREVLGEVGGCGGGVADDVDIVRSKRALEWVTSAARSNCK